mgnify:FL=1|jgi:hypothetical protein
MNKGTHAPAPVQPVKVDTKAGSVKGGKVDFGYAGTARKGKKA